MKVSLKQHKAYLAEQFTESEFFTITKWVDKEWLALYLPWLDKPDPKESEDFLIWRWMITMFKSLPNGKKTKAFVYQMLVMNDLAPDGVHGKDACPLMYGRCPIVKWWLDKLSRPWQEKDRDNICGNLGICILMPYLSPYKFSIDKIDSRKEIVIDDRILQRGKL